MPRQHRPVTEPTVVPLKNSENAGTRSQRPTEYPKRRGNAILLAARLCAGAVSESVRRDINSPSARVGGRGRSGHSGPGRRAVRTCDWREPNGVLPGQRCWGVRIRPGGIGDARSCAIGASAAARGQQVRETCDRGAWRGRETSRQPVDLVAAGVEQERTEETESDGRACLAVSVSVLREWLWPVMRVLSGRGCSGVGAVVRRPAPNDLCRARQRAPPVMGSRARGREGMFRVKESVSDGGRRRSSLLASP